MSSRMFRDSALDRLSSPEQLDQAIKVTSPGLWIVLCAMVGTVLGLIVLSLVSSVPLRVKGDGILLERGGVLDVVTGSGGRLVSLPVEIGQTIATGQVVATVSKADLLQDLTALRAELEEMVAHRARVADFHQRDAALQRVLVEQKQSSFEQRQLSLSERARWLEERLQNLSGLRDRGFITADRYFETLADLNTTQDALAQVAVERDEIQLEILNAEIENQREILRIDLDIQNLRRRIETLTARIDRESTVLSPHAGRIVELKSSPGEVLVEGRALFSVLPIGDTAETQTLEGILFVPPGEGKRLAPGMEARVVPSTVRREEFGHVVAEVVSVAEVPSTREGIMRILRNERLVEQLTADGAPFEVRVRLRLDPRTPSGFEWSSSEGPPQVLAAGTLFAGEVVTSREAIAGLFLPSLRRLLDRSGP